MLAGEVEQGVEIFDGLKVDMSSSSAVAAVGPALGDKFFAAEADAARAAVARLDVDFCLVDKHGFVVRPAYIVLLLSIYKKRMAVAILFLLSGFWGFQVMCTFRPRKSTVPSVVAKSV